MLLCDHAQVANGKLYVLGGGWTTVATPDSPIPVALAVVLMVDWTATNEKHQLLTKLIDDDGQPVELGGIPIQNGGEFEVGRPPGTKAGSAITQPMVFKFEGLPLPAGGYVFELTVDDEVLARTPFRVG